MKVFVATGIYGEHKEIIGLLSQWAGNELGSTGEMLQCFGKIQGR